MNRSNFMHAAWALAFQALIGLTTGNWWAGAAFGAAFFLGREHAQREYKLTAGGSVKGLDPWEAFDLARWSPDALADLIVPVIAVVIVALLV